MSHRTDTASSHSSVGSGSGTSSPRRFHTRRTNSWSGGPPNSSPSGAPAASIAQTATTPAAAAAPTAATAAAVVPPTYTNVVSPFEEDLISSASLPYSQYFYSYFGYAYLSSSASTADGSLSRQYSSNAGNPYFYPISSSSVNSAKTPTVGYNMFSHSPPGSTNPFAENSSAVSPAAALPQSTVAAIAAATLPSTPSAANRRRYPSFSIITAQSVQSLASATTAPAAMSVSTAVPTPATPAAVTQPTNSAGTRTHNPFAVVRDAVVHFQSRIGAAFEDNRELDEIHSSAESFDEDDAEESDSNSTQSYSLSTTIPSSDSAAAYANGRRRHMLYIRTGNASPLPNPAASQASARGQSSASTPRRDNYQNAGTNAAPVPNALAPTAPVPLTSTEIFVLSVKRYVARGIDKINDIQKSWPFNIIVGIALVLVTAAATFLLIHVLTVHNHLITRCGGAELVLVLLPFVFFVFFSVLVALYLVKNVMDKNNININSQIQAKLESVRPGITKAPVVILEKLRDVPLYHYTIGQIISPTDFLGPPQAGSNAVVPMSSNPARATTSRIFDVDDFDQELPPRQTAAPMPASLRMPQASPASSSSHVIHGRKRSKSGYRYALEEFDSIFMDEEYGQQSGVVRSATGGVAATLYYQAALRRYQEEDNSRREKELLIRYHRRRRIRLTIIYAVKLLIVMLGLLCFAALVFVVAFTITIAQASLPDYTKDYQFNSLYGSKVRIYREPSGVVHILAETYHDMFFAYGFAAAYDRLFQMEINKRTGRGTLSEWLGKNALQTDVFSRTIGFYQTANYTLSALTDRSKAALQAYCDGINAYAAVTLTYAPQFGLLVSRPSKFEPVDVLIWLKMFAWSLSGNADMELQRLSLLEKGLSLQRVSEILPTFARDLDPVTVTKQSDYSYLFNVSDSFVDGVEDDFASDAGAYVPSKSAYRSVGASSLFASSHYDSTEYSSSSPYCSTFSGRLSLLVSYAWRILSGSWYGLVSSAASSSSLSSFVYLTDDTSFRDSVATEVNRWASRVLYDTRRARYASNAFVLGGDFTKSGKPLLANDPHLPLTAPMLWYLCHLYSAEGSINAIGVSFPNAPGIVIGHNSHFSWGISASSADQQDIFVLQEVKAGSTYSVNGQEVAYLAREETIAVFGVVYPQKIIVRTSYFGPVINDISSTLLSGFSSSVPLALQWVGNMEMRSTVNGFLDLLFAKDWNGFTAAAGQIACPSLHIVYADEVGNIGYILTGQLPVRRKGHSGAFAVKGDGTYVYDRFLGFAELPQILNPTRGFIVAANNRASPYGYSVAIGMDMPHSFRAYRIEDLLSRNATNGTYATMDQIASMQVDVFSVLFDSYLRPAIASIKPFTGDYETWRQNLVKWDGNESIFSREASLFEALVLELRRLPDKETGGTSSGDLVHIIRALRTGDTACNPTDCVAFLRQAFVNAVDNMKRRWGSVDRWGYIHQTTFPSPILDSTPLACYAGRTIYTVGGTETVNLADVTSIDFNSDRGVAYRQLVDLSKFDYSHQLL